MFSPPLGASSDSCVRQNPDFGAWSIKLPIARGKARPSGSPGVGTAPDPATLAGGVHRRGAPGCVGRRTAGEVRGHQVLWDREGGGRRERRDLCLVPALWPGVHPAHPQSVQGLPTFIHPPPPPPPPRGRRSQIFEVLYTKVSVFLI